MDGSYQSFVVRLWVVDGEARRGVAVHSETGAAVRFADLSDLPDLFRRLTADWARVQAGEVAEPANTSAHQRYVTLDSSPSIRATRPPEATQTPAGPDHLEIRDTAQLDGGKHI